MEQPLDSEKKWDFGAVVAGGGTEITNRIPGVLGENSLKPTDKRTRQSSLPAHLGMENYGYQKCIQVPSNSQYMVTFE